MSMQSFVINEQFSHETVIECGMLIILGFVQVVWHWCQKAAEGKGTLVHEIFDNGDLSSIIRPLTQHQWLFET